MSTVYLDYNLIAIMGGRTHQNAEFLEDQILQLIANGDRVALSAWHAIELSRSQHENYIEACINLVGRLQPLWLSNPSYVKTEEIKGFLVKELQDPRFEPRANLALNKTISQMWSTYGGEVFVGETFGDIVNALHKSPPSKALTDAIRQTPKAILTGREAVKDGRAKSYESAIQKEYFKGIVPHGVTTGTIDYLVANTDRVRELCPAIAVEHCLTRIRQTEEFVPEESDAADLQHATVAVAYCDFFVSDDKMLVEHCQRTAKTVGVNCMVRRDFADISIQ